MSWYLTILILGPFCIVCVIILDILFKRCRANKWDAIADHSKDLLERRWVQTDIEIQLQPVQRIRSRLSMQEQIQQTDSLHQLMPFIERIDLDVLKKLLVAHYDAIIVNTTGATATATDDVGEDPDDEAIEIKYRAYGGRESSSSSVSLIVSLNTPNTPKNPEDVGNHKDATKMPINGDREPSNTAENPKEVEDLKDEAKETIKMAVDEQQKLVKLFKTNRDVWRKKMTNEIRQHPNQFDIILQILNNNDTDGEITMKQFQTAFPALNKTLIECMFEDIGSFEGKASDEERLKLTTILRWMNFKSCVFKEVECVKNKCIIVSLYHSLDKYLEYKAGDNGKGAVIKRMRRNKYGKPLSAKYGLNEE
eukprot:388669_1